MGRPRSRLHSAGVDVHGCLNVRMPQQLLRHLHSRSHLLHHRGVGIVIRQILVIGEDLKRGIRSIKEIVVFDDEEISEENPAKLCQGHHIPHRRTAETLQKSQPVGRTATNHCGKTESARISPLPIQPGPRDRSNFRSSSATSVSATAICTRWPAISSLQSSSFAFGKNSRRRANHFSGDSRTWPIR